MGLEFDAIDVEDVVKEGDVIICGDLSMVVGQMLKYIAATT